MNTVAAYSIKGGVGKTAFAVNFAYACAQRGKRVLLLDLDPQGAASFYFRVQPCAKLKGRRLMAGKEGLEHHVRESDYPGLDVLPAKLSFRHFDLVLSDSSNPRRQLRAMLKPLAKEYDVAVVDAPPSLSLLSESILDAADLVASPVVPTPLSGNTLAQLAAFMDEHPPRHRPVLLPFFSMVERRKRLHRDTMEQLRAMHPEIPETVIPYAADVERMGLTKAPLLATRPSCPAGRAFAALTGEVLAGLKSHASG